MRKIVFVPVAVVMLVAAATLFQASADEQPVTQMFDRNACYSQCPCGFSGAVQLCLDCKEKCDEKFWDAFDKEENDAEN